MSEQLSKLYHDFMQGIYATGEGVRADTFIAASKLMPADAQLSVYRGSVHEGLLQALAGIYETVCKGLGASNFRHLAQAYVSAHPSRSSRLDDYGESFPQFLASHRIRQHEPYIADVARLDWYWHMAFHAADPPPVDPHEIARCLEHESDNCYLTLAPGAALLVSSFPLFDLWRACRGLQSENVDWNAAAQSCLVWREGLDVSVAHASEAVLTLFETIEKTGTYGTKLESLLSELEQQEAVGALISALKQGWLQLALR